MHSVSRIRYSVSEAKTLFGDLLRRPSIDAAYGPDFIAGREVALPRGANSRATQVALVIWVPLAFKHKLAEWSVADISYENHSTHNLLHNWVFACLDSGEESLFLPCDAFLTLYMTVDTVVRLVFVSDDEVVDVVHRFGGEHAEEVIGGLQGQFSCTGPNYNPYRLYSEEELAAVEHLGNYIKFPGWLVQPDDL